MPTPANTDSKAFTLSETMIVLIVLGVVATLTIPALVRRQIEAAERAKIKKSMTVYDYVFNKMVTENNIRSNPEIQSFAPDGDCTNTAPYFKSAENKDNNICKFKTSDGVWWNISDITHPNISLNKDDLDNPNSKKTFTLVGHFDDNGSLRIDDKNVETGLNAEYLSKLYDFINNKSVSTTEADPNDWKSYLPQEYRNLQEIDVYAYAYSDELIPGCYNDSQYDVSDYIMRIKNYHIVCVNNKPVMSVYSNSSTKEIGTTYCRENANGQVAISNNGQQCDAESSIYSTSPCITEGYNNCNCFTIGDFGGWQRCSCTK